MKSLNINIQNNNYEILIEKGLFNNFGTEIKKIYKNTKISIITDENLYELYGSKLNDVLINENFSVNFIVIKPGEESKSLNTLEHVYSKLALFNITRSDLIIAFGGGVIGDLGGFAASTYLRGIDYIQIPTSLLAQIDSSIGGKVAINLKEGKNLAGSFYHPKKVLIDPKVLLTLPERHIKDGLGEVIKYACIKSPELYETLININSNSKEEFFNNIESLIYNCCNIKKELVEEDERDTGLRMLLNFGHTIGHAIEKHMNYNITHGEAVALGMLCITKNSQTLSLTEVGTYEKIKTILAHYNINEKLENIKTEDLKKLILLDKKNLSGEINLILLRKIGSAFIHKVAINDAEEFISIDLKSSY